MTAAVTDRPSMPEAARPRPVGSPQILDRLASVIVGVVAALLIGGWMLERLGTLRTGPTLILGAAGGYSLYALATQERRAPTRSALGGWAGRVLVVLLLGWPVVLGWFGTGYPLVDGLEAAHQLTATRAAVTGTLDQPLDFPVDPSVDADLPGIVTSSETWTVDDTRFWTIGLTEASWLGRSAASRTGALLASILLLLVFVVAARFVPAGVAVVAVAATAVSLPLVLSARFLGSDLLGAVLFVGGIFLVIEAVESGSLSGAVPAGVVLGLAPGISPWFACVPVAAAIYAVLVVPRVGAAGYTTRDRLQRPMIGLAIGLAPALLISGWELVRAGMVGRAAPAVALALPVLLVAVVARRFWPARPGVRAGQHRAISLAALGALLVVLAAAWVVDVDSLSVVRRMVGSPLLVVGVAGLAWASIRPATVVAERRELVLLTFGGIAALVGLIVRPEPGVAAAGALIPAVVVLSIGATVLIDLWFRDPERYVLQTVALFGAVSLLVVPVARLLDYWDLEPQAGATSSMDRVCDQIEVDAAVLVLGAADDTDILRLVAGGIRLVCEVPAVILPPDATGSAVTRFELLAYENDRTPYAASLVVLPLGLGAPDLVAADGVDVGVELVTWGRNGLPFAGEGVEETVRIGVFD